MPFNFEQAIRSWRQNIQRQTALEPGFIEELESGLHDRYEEYLIRGLTPEEAFEQAKAKVAPDHKVAAKEFRKASSPASGSIFGSFFFLFPSYLKMALRNLRRKRFFNLVNYTCLAVGILTTTLAVLYLQYETGFDTMIPSVDQKYRVGMNLRSQGYSMLSYYDYFSTTPDAQQRYIEGFRSVKGVEQACQFFTFTQPQILRTANKELRAEDILQTNTPEDFFEFFGWPFLEGSKENFGQSRYTAVLTQSEAARLYGKDWQQQNLLDQVFKIDTQQYAIAGIIEDLPSNAHYNFNIALHVPKITYWGARTYIKLADGEEAATVRKRIDENMVNINGRLAEDELFNGTIIQSLTSIHLHSDLLYELKPPGDRRYLYIIGIISGIILLLTIGNYTNLSIAMNASRAREMGLRKIFGATEGKISRQFMLESLVLSVLTLPVVALGLNLLLPWFNNFMGTGLDEGILTSPLFWSLLLLLTLSIGLLASLYSSLYMAQHPILQLFRGDWVKNTGKGISTRKVIISLQFVLLISLCSLTLFINQQLRYIQDKDLGYEKEQIVYVSLSADSSKYQTFRNELLQIPEVTGVGSGTPLGSDPYNQTTYKLEGTDEVFDDATNLYLDYEAVKLLGIKTSIPDYIENPDAAPRRLVIINETLSDRLQNRFKLSREELIGRAIVQEPEYTDEETGQVGFPFEIAGTFEDINMFSLREKVNPMFLNIYRNPRYVDIVSVAWTGISPSAILEKISATYDDLQVNQAMDHSFLTQNLEELYAKEQRIARLSIYFSAIAFAVAVIGLIALTTYLTTLKRKEIGIRQILGASRLDILRRFNSEYVWLVGISLLVAAPLTWYGISSWLSTFAYRIDINILVFLIAGAITLLITCVAVSLIAMRAANAIPVEALQESQ
ncbi:MAG: FtsX-like permease family protein [Bacteroidota bacterium]